MNVPAGMSTYPLGADDVLPSLPVSVASGRALWEDPVASAPEDVESPPQRHGS